jgi:hypothetical protein
MGTGNPRVFCGFLMGTGTGMEIKTRRKPVPVGNTRPYRVYPCTCPYRYVYQTHFSLICFSFDTIMPLFEAPEEVATISHVIHPIYHHLCPLALGAHGITQ